MIPIIKKIDITQNKCIILQMYDIFDSLNAVENELREM